MREREAERETINLESRVDIEAASPREFAEAVADLNRDKARSAVRACQSKSAVREVSTEDKRKTIREVAVRRFYRLEMEKTTDLLKVGKRSRKPKKAAKAGRPPPLTENDSKVCPRCGDTKKVKDFGFRTMKYKTKANEHKTTTRPQSYCYGCRNGHSKQQRAKHSTKKREAAEQVRNTSVEDFIGNLKANLGGEE